jgi:hypothetical protein
MVKWCEREEKYLKQMHDVCVNLSRDYMILYKFTYRLQTRLRLPAIILSSFSGVASFGSTSFPRQASRYISITVGVINVGIAMIQTYESYLKIGDIVAKSLNVASSLKKLADDIYCEIFIPVEDRESDGIMFLRDCFSRYQVIMEQAPPLNLKSEAEEELLLKSKKMVESISTQLNQYEFVERTEFGKTFRPTNVTNFASIDQVLHRPQEARSSDVRIVVN